MKKKIIEIVNPNQDNFWNTNHSKVSVLIEVYEDWNCKDGTVKKKDISNREKFLIDSIFEALGLDDRYIFEHTMRKVQSMEEKAIVTIEALE